ncbi:uncharacterized protein LOC128388698 isoform X2 [Panonychus citri]|uniref:uncharacterized protein LOC128388698 isoform X2 n=1 Tax=Panonychus citri TaxID=50023 RepID=UPI002307060C|nr:uncharacterized protein LOC128388698 isoform X2 [Panonychus citri]
MFVWSPLFLIQLIVKILNHLLVPDGFKYFYSVKEKITNRLRQRISEGVLNNMFTEGDRILDSMKREVDQSPSLVKTEMNSNWATINGEWAKFKTIARTNPGTLIGGPSI